jgi:hypothetical protein
MRTRLAAIVIACGVLAVALRAEAGTFTFQPASVSVEVPTGWSTDDQGNYVTFGTADQSLAINLAYGGTDLAAAWKTLEAEVKKVVTGVKVKKKAGVLGGMDGFVSSGKGKLGGTKVSVMLAALETPSGVVTVFVIGQVGTYEKHEKDMTAFLASLAEIITAPPRYVDDDDGYKALPETARSFADRLAKAIDDNDVKTFLKMVKPKGFDLHGKSFTRDKLKKKLTKKMTLRKLLKLPATGSWQVVDWMDDASNFRMWGGGGGPEVAVERNADGRYELTSVFFMGVD